MKTFFTLIALFFTCTVVFAQDPIKNFSFENWKTDTLGKLAPEDWSFYKEDVAKNALKRHTSGSQGSHALYLGSYVYDGDVVGAEAEIRDTVIEVPASISFDYIVQNNNSSFFNGLAVELYFYDGNDDFIEDYTWTSGFTANNSAFRKGELGFAKTVIASAKSYLMRIAYYNLGGTTSEYGVIDNLKFNKTSSNVSVGEVATGSTVNFYPNPAAKTLNFTTAQNQNIDKIIITAIDGRQTTYTSNTFVNNSIDISTLANGVYFVTALNAEGTQVHSQKIIVNN